MVIGRIKILTGLLLRTFKHIGEQIYGLVGNYWGPTFMTEL